MTIKRHPSPDGPAARCFELAHEAGAMVALRAEFEDRVVSFPLDQIRRWTLYREEPERLLIQIGEELALVVTGFALREIHEALDRGRLAVLRSVPARQAQEPWIKSLTILDRPKGPAPHRAGKEK